MNYEDLKIGYAISCSSKSFGYTGAILITDYKGFPLEFQYTDPIAPTKIQQVLYGNGLEKYIKVNVILSSLLNVISNNVDILIVQDEDMLTHKTDNLFTIRVSSTKSTPLSNPGEISKVKKNEYLLQTSHSSNPLRIKFKQDFNDESEEFQNIVDIITEAGNFIDVAEPLDRVYNAVELICSQEK